MTMQMSETPAARIPIVMELETGDPDDILAFLFILEHPRALLKAIVMSPGSPDQIGLIRHLLTKYHHPDVPIGAFNLDHPKPTVSEWHYKTFGHFESSRDAVDGAALILELCTPDTTILCCGPMRNLGKAIQVADETHSDFTIGKVVIQGGFVGRNIVPESVALEKFKDKEMVPSWNLDGALKDTLRVLQSPRCCEIRLVSKNVCHGVTWDETLSSQITDQGSDMLHTIDAIMTAYRQRKGAPKIIHDLVAATCALSATVCGWAQVSVRHNKKAGWGADLSKTSNTYIVTSFNPSAFVRTLCERPE
jgi:pyrimidine-specific ribonucleoside hydrolase